MNQRRRPASKLSDEQIKAIRSEYAMGATQGSLARKYNMSIGHVGRIVRNEVWTDRGQLSGA